MCFKFGKSRPATGKLTRRWSKQPVGVYIGPCARSDAPLLVIDALRSFHSDFRFAMVSEPMKADISIKFYNGPWKEGSATAAAPPADAENLGGTVVLDPPKGTPHNATLWLNLYVLEDHGGYPEVFKAVTLHEFGHAVGLDHGPDPNGLMNPANIWGGRVKSFSPSELKLINEAY